MDHQFIIKELETVMSETADFIRGHFGRVRQDQVETKSVNSLVSFVDKEAELMLSTKLAQLVPEAGFLTEEQMVSNSVKKMQWIIDPLDGTTNFITGIPHFSISIALYERSEAILGAVYDVMQKNFYSAIKGQGAFCNGRPIRVNPPKLVSEMLIATGFPYDKSKITPEFDAALHYYVHHSRCVRRLGSAALDLCFTAQGTFDLYFEMHLNPWDIAAGTLIVEEAGGIALSLAGTKDHSGGHLFACSKDAAETISWLTQHFNNTFKN
ncbi:MAG TPA: inositol monophosphatase [Saprospirales bacterium]|nr:inositol monophosphatase [Saprospirales bacterium]HAY70409.1 inositol monophosphatase [Saprospirales bacterium]HRQ28933.1 inositol monophosphatase family protein [Saprospiraceae bacterium]